MITQPHKLALTLLSSAFAATVTTLFELIQGWVLLLCACSIGARLAIVFGLQTHAPSLRTINLLALFCAIVLAYFAWQLGLMLAMLNLLVMACALKLIALQRQKDYLQLLLSLFFLIGCGFIFQQSMLFTLIYSLFTWLLLASLSCYFSPGLSIQQQTKQLLLLCAKAMPIGLILFLVLPQIGPLWQMPTTRSASTGITDKLTPGDYAQLSQSGQLAFRATFIGSMPPPQQRYWRALVLEHFDGNSWTVHQERTRFLRKQQQNQQEFTPELTGEKWQYQLMMQATQQRWLFALDLATPHNAASHAAIWQTHSYQLLSHRPILSQTQYQLAAFPDSQLAQTNGEFDQRLNLQLPNQGNAQTRAWVTELMEKHPQKQHFIAALISYFQTQNFIYTLRPALMPTDVIDKFLFEYQAGFCAHYASAFAYVLRLAGIPARLVVGYQGGEEHEGNYLSVHQYDAHAWVEAWYDERGWQRIDPTAIVSLTRIELGLQAAMQQEGSFLAEAPFALTKLRDIAWINQLRLILTELDYRWSRWVLGFNQQQQHDLIKAIIGSMTHKRLMLFGLATFSIVALLLGLFFLPDFLRKKTNPILSPYFLAEQQLARLGIQRPNWQAANDFSAQISKQLPQPIAEVFHDISRTMQALRYAQTATSEQAQNQQTKSQHAKIKHMHRQSRKLKRLVNKHTQG